MKLKAKFVFFFIVGLISFIFLTGLFVAVASEYLIPIVTKTPELVTFLESISMLFPFIFGGLLLGLFFVNPLIYMISLIKELSFGQYQLKGLDKKIYRENGKLKKRYFLYKELIDDIYTLAKNLEESKVQRIQLEEAKTNWIAGVSHDLKTPLSYIMGYSSLLLDMNKEWPQEEQKFLFEIHDKSVRIKELIDDLNLSFKLDTLGSSFPLNIQQVDIIDLIQRLLADIASNPRANGYEFSFQSLHEKILMYIDKKLISRAIQNILINAINHNPVGTCINVEVLHDNPTEEIIISIKDNGVGMNELLLNTLLQPYNQLKKTDNISGGLGFFVVKSIIEAHDGRIQVESFEEEGTTVRVILENRNKGWI